MEQVMMMGMQTCQHYSEKMMQGHTLNEFEQQMYESLARCLRKYANLQRKIMKIHMLSAKKQFTEDEKQHQEWLEQQIPKIDPEFKSDESYYIKGAKDRAHKTTSMNSTEEYDRGWQDMTEILSPIETEIIAATIRYKVMAEDFVNKLEEDFRAGNNAKCAGHPATDAFPSTGNASS